MSSSEKQSSSSEDAEVEVVPAPSVVLQLHRKRAAPSVDARAPALAKKSRSTTSSKRENASKVWELKREDGSLVFSKTNGKVECSVCKHKFKLTEGVTSNLVRHLQSQHDKLVRRCICFRCSIIQLM